MKPQNKFNVAEAGTLWSIKKVIETCAGIPLWENPKIIERDLGWRNENNIHWVHWTDARVLKLGEAVVTERRNSSYLSFEKVMVYNQKKAKLIIGWIAQEDCQYLIPIEREKE